jgi:hypothetical protein
MVKNWVMTHTIRNNKYDDGAQNQMKKKNKDKKPKPNIRGDNVPFCKLILRSRNPSTKKRFEHEH